MDAILLGDWLLRFGKSSLLVRERLAEMAEWLANDSPPWAAYRALMTGRIVALDKCPGVRPVGWGRLSSASWQSVFCWWQGMMLQPLVACISSVGG